MQGALCQALDIIIQGRHNGDSIHDDHDDRANSGETPHLLFQSSIITYVQASKAPSQFHLLSPEKHQ